MATNRHLGVRAIDDTAIATCWPENSCLLQAKRGGNENHKTGENEAPDGLRGVLFAGGDDDGGEIGGHHCRPQLARLRNQLHGC